MIFFHRDGNTAAAFHEKCDDKGPTIVIAKIKNSEQIVGGYNPLDWKPVEFNSDYYKSTNDSFIFTFTDRNNLQTAKVNYPSNKYSIYCSSDRGPMFDFDLACYNNGNWIRNSHTYSDIDSIPYSFIVNDYEVFQIKHE